MYTLSNLLVKVAGLVLLAFYLDPALLSQADYGRFQLLEAAAQFLVLVGGFGLAAGMLKFLHDARYRDRRAALPWTTLAGTLLCAVVAAGLLVLFERALAAFLVDDAGAVWPVRFAALYVGLKLVEAVPFMVLRAYERAGLFALAATTEAALLVGTVVVFLDAGHGLNGVMAGYVVSAGGVTLALTALMLVRYPPRFDASLLRPLFAFGAPLAVASAAAVALNAGDRFVLKAFTDADTVGVYGLAAKYAGLVNMLFVQSFNMAFAVIGLKALAPEGEGADVHRRTFRHFVVLTGWGVLGVALLARDVTAALSPNPAFLEAEPLVLPLALGFMAYGIYYIAMNLLYAGGRTGTIAAGVAAAAAANLALNVLAIPRYGAMGAALASLAAYAGLAALTMWRARREAAVAYRWDALVSVLFLVLGLWVLAQPSVGWSTAARLPFRLALIAAYPAGVLLAGLYAREEVRTLLRAPLTVLRSGPEQEG
ncbi:MAG: oligosaccharide flippase family protein [Rubricoccaceae bacterium]|nr:oligosaccharide flippase family protein [Rubricoccaceae bacterium]